MVPDRNTREVIHLIDAYGDALAVEISEEYFRRYPDDSRAWDLATHREYVHDTIRHLHFLSEALAVGEAILFVHQVAWAQILMQQRNQSTNALEATLLCMATVLERHIPVTAGSLCRSYIEAGLARLHHLPAVEPPPVNSGRLSQLTRMYLDALLRGKRRHATSIVMSALEAGADVRDIYLRVFQTAQYEVGRLWHINRINIAQANYYTAVSQSIISRLYSRVFSAERNGRRLVATCVFAERHEIGIRMVSDFFEIDGWDTYYLAAGTPSKSVVRLVGDKRADLLLVSVTMALHLTRAKQLIELVRSSDAYSAVRVLVGGYIFNIVPGLWKKMGADGYARDAAKAVIVARSLFESKSAATGAANQAP